MSCALYSIEKESVLFRSEVEDDSLGFDEGKHFSEVVPEDVFGFWNVCSGHCRDDLQKHVFKETEEDGQCKEPEQGIVGGAPVLSEDYPSRSHFDAIWKD